MPLYDMHTHTDNSPDSHQPIAGLCEAALQKGLAGIAVTDHSDTPFLHQNNTCGRIARSIAQTEEMQRCYAGRLEILKGVELGEQLWARREAEEILQLTDYDVILGSQHGFLRNGQVIYYSAENFDAAHYTDLQLDAFLRRYLETELETAETCEYDVLTHLDCPVRYINGKYGRSRDILQNADLIEQILCAVIRRDKSLEINTSGTATAWGQRMPQNAVLRRYAQLGGKKITLGSDAHLCGNAAAGLQEAAAFARQLGFAGQTLYRRRKPVFIPFD